LLLLVGHLVGFLFPRWLAQWNTSALRLYATETLGFVLGLVALGGWAVKMWRHLWHSNGTPIRQAADAVLLSVLFTVLLSGSLMAVLFRWGSSWGVLTLTPYVVSLFRGRPAVGLMIDMPFLVRLHVFAGFAMLALLPATPLALLMVVALSRRLGPIVTVGFRMLRPLQRLIERLARKMNPASLIWPEED
jgi:nitrate reductase gamma subunit